MRSLVYLSLGATASKGETGLGKVRPQTVNGKNGRVLAEHPLWLAVVVTRSCAMVQTFKVGTKYKLRIAVPRLLNAYVQELVPGIDYIGGAKEGWY